MTIFLALIFIISSFVAILLFLKKIYINFLRVFPISVISGILLAIHSYEFLASRSFLSVVYLAFFAGVFAFIMSSAGSAIGALLNKSDKRTLLRNVLFNEKS